MRSVNTYAMKTKDFDYDLPEHLIAYEPLPERSASRLLCLDRSSGATDHRIFSDITDFLSEGDLLVFNNSKVIPARLTGRRDTGGRASILIERVLSPYKALAHVKTGNVAKAGSYLYLSDETPVQVTGRDGSFFILEVDQQRTWQEIMEAIGDIPLPPYIERQTKALDSQRYQTVYAADDKAASVAAPTAGLHFDEALLGKLKDKGVACAYVTLHVGAGTFQPLRTGDDEDPRGHPMHSEYIEVNEDVCKAVADTKARGGKVIAIGTTSVRCLETAFTPDAGCLQPYIGETDIFISPGYKFGAIDGLITNFHFPRTTLLMLVSALSGRDAMMSAYQEAIEQHYRFFSYGDAMFIAPNLLK